MIEYSAIIDPIVEQKMDVIAEEIFGTVHDDDQIPITQESGEKLTALTSHWVKYRLDEKGDPIAWVIVLPTTKELAHRFAEGEITEKQLLDLTTPQDAYSAIYLCAAVTIPHYRRQGFAFELFKEAINSIAKTDDHILFVWPFGEGGLEVARKVGKDLSREVLVRE